MEIDRVNIERVVINLDKVALVDVQAFRSTLELELSRLLGSPHEMPAEWAAAAQGESGMARVAASGIASQIRAAVGR